MSPNLYNNKMENKGVNDLYDKSPKSFNTIDPFPENTPIKKNKQLVRRSSDINMPLYRQYEIRDQKLQENLLEKRKQTLNFLRQFKQAIPKEEKDEH